MLVNFIEFLLQGSVFRHFSICSLNEFHLKVFFLIIHCIHWALRTLSTKVSFLLWKLAWSFKWDKSYKLQYLVQIMTKQKSISIGLWITFWRLFKSRLQILQMIREDWGRVSNFQLFTITSTTKQCTHAHYVCIWVFPACLSHIRHQSELTKREKENTVQGVGKASIWVTTSVRCGYQKISHNSIKYLKDQIKQIVVLVLGHESLSEYRK